MGFLDFLKKDPHTTPSLAPPPSSAPAPPPDAWPADVPPLPPSPSVPFPSAPVVPLPPLDVPSVSPAAPPAWTADPTLKGPAQSQWTADLPPAAPTPPPAMPPMPAIPAPIAVPPADLWAAPPATPQARDDVPLPPPALQDAGQPPKAAAPAPIAPLAAIASPTAPTSPSPAASALDLPDFTDEDLVMIEQLESPLSKLAKSGGKAETIKPFEVSVKVVSEEPIVAAPANAVAVADDSIILPLGEELQLEELEPARFVSSHAYLKILAEVKAVRKSLRTSDDFLKDSSLRHDQLDAQFKRVAADVNSIQEQLIAIDSSLFED